MARRHEGVLLTEHRDSHVPWWSVEALVTDEVPARNGPAGSVDIVWSRVSGMFGPFYAKRNALREGRAYAKRNGCPFYIQESAKEEPDGP